MILAHQVIADSCREFDFAMSHFKESQDLRHSYILRAKKAGDMLAHAKQVFTDEGFGPRNPLQIKDRFYTKFGEVIKDFTYVYESLVGPIDPDLKEEYFTGSQVNKCMSLARRWEITEYLSDLFTFKHTYRLSKTLDIFKWAEDKLKENPNLEPGSLSCAQYWLEQEELKALRRAEREALPSYQQLMDRVMSLEGTLDAKDSEIARLKKELEDMEARLRKMIAESASPYRKRPTTPQVSLSTTTSKSSNPISFFTSCPPPVLI
jgi:hypothetical protein